MTELSGAELPSQPAADVVDIAGLGEFLASAVPEAVGNFELERLGEGQSCLTYLVRGEGWEVVLRRPPRGELPPTAYDVAREYRVMKALSDSGTDVPVPRPIALCRDPAVIGAPFYLMEKVNGLVVRQDIPGAFASLEDRKRMGKELLETLVTLHRVEYQSIGLGDFGRSNGYLERQLRRMGERWQATRFRDIPEIDEVGSWLASKIPAQSGPALLHGDYKLDNVIFAARSPARLIAVVDWEMSTIGDPLADLGWLLYFWRDPDEMGFRSPVTSVTDLPGFARRRDLLNAYANESEAPVEDMEWYIALAGWKIAIILEASYARFLSGVGDHMFGHLEEDVPAMARRALAAARGLLTS